MWISDFSKINRKIFFKIKRESVPNGNEIKEMAESHFFYSFLVTTQVLWIFVKIVLHSSPLASDNHHS